MGVFEKVNPKIREKSQERSPAISNPVTYRICQRCIGFSENSAWSAKISESVGQAMDVMRRHSSTAISLRSDDPFTKVL